MFKAQLAEIRQYNEESKNKLSQAMIENRRIEDDLLRAANEKAYLKEQIDKCIRKGRQITQAGTSQEQKKKREDRVSGRSFEGSSGDNRSDASSFVAKGNMMVIPEDDNADQPCFGGATSPQTHDLRDTHLGSGRDKELSVIFSENQSSHQDQHTLSESQHDGSMTNKQTLVETRNTLIEGKEASKSRGKNKR